ncbi:endonuclease domain-containing protein [Streptomyces sp. NPDC055103]
MVQLLRPDLVCSHTTAARLHRAELLDVNGGRRRDGQDPSEPMEFTTHRPGSSGITGRTDVRVHSAHSLTQADWSVRAGLRVTTPVRTIGDLIRRGPREEAVVVADSALSRRTVSGVRREALVHHDALVAELSSPRPGAALAREWLRLTDPEAGSPAETIARLRMHDAGLRPESQPVLRTADGRALRPDFLFRAAGLVVEIEGFAFHGDRRAHERDIARFNALQTCPEVRRVLRFTARDVFDRPDRVIATIRTALALLAPTPTPTPTPPYSR